MVDGLYLVRNRESIKFNVVVAAESKSGQEETRNLRVFLRLAIYRASNTLRRLLSQVKGSLWHLNTRTKTVIASMINKADSVHTTK